MDIDEGGELKENRIPFITYVKDLSTRVNIFTHFQFGILAIITIDLQLSDLEQR